jgi:hypothetical protein
MNTFETIAFYFAIGLAVISCVILARTVLVAIITIISEAFANFLLSNKGETEDVEA